MRNVTTTGNSTPAESSGYSPAVPITVYRELSAELDSTKAQLQATSVHNQQLSRENQLLRQEIEKLMQSAFRAQQAVNSLQSQPSPSFASETLHQNNAAFADYSNEPVAKNPFAVLESEAAVSPAKNRLFTEEQETRPRRSQKPSARDMGGMWFAVAILLIVVAAFGAGYWVVRPMLLKR
ncbi:hypothetical protein NG798_06620 [Ancylothrix sp. C2]|uniref:hypothetical protein n=1 Tax=Ancylothrix sp. D3o TaxID=2953691 RepID=UPI0021BA6455|nr:hypothetical protein [Ancylothrix sp. D3o]MCT7949453.1 hypothetical protein [Ancylothrix sp. D3o]